jgi:hypothetical protein
MADETTKPAADPFTTCGEMMKGAAGGSGAECPMAGMLNGVTAKPSSGLLLMLPGLVLVVVGVLIIIEPRVLATLMAVTSILLGIVLLTFATFLRRLGARIRSAHEQP